jgi:hypothetical protein
VQRATSVDLMKWTTLLIIGLVAAYFIYRVYQFVAKRRSKAKKQAEKKKEGPPQQPSGPDAAVVTHVTHEPSPYAQRIPSFLGQPAPPPTVREGRPRAAVTERSGEPRSEGRPLARRPAGATKTPEGSRPSSPPFQPAALRRKEEEGAAQIPSLPPAEAAGDASAKDLGQAMEVEAPGEDSAATPAGRAVAVGTRGGSTIALRSPSSGNPADAVALRARRPSSPLEAMQGPQTQITIEEVTEEEEEAEEQGLAGGNTTTAGARVDDFLDAMQQSQRGVGYPSPAPRSK